MRSYNMAYDPWMLNAMEEYGYTDTNDGLINRVRRNTARTPERREHS